MNDVKEAVNTVKADDLVSIEAFMARIDELSKTAPLKARLGLSIAKSMLGGLTQEDFTEMMAYLKELIGGRTLQTVEIEPGLKIEILIHYSGVKKQ